jgi:hypothetical protein
VKEEPKVDPPADAGADEPAPPAETPATDPKPTTDAEPNTDPPSDPTPPTTDPAPPATPEFSPLSEVRDQILGSLASQPAQERMNAAFAKVEAALRTYVAETSVQRTQARDKNDATLKPKVFDVAKAAKAAGLEYGELPLMGPFEMQETEIGAAQARGGSPFGGGISFIQTAFADDRQVFRPDNVTAGRTEFTFWMTYETDDFVPDFKAAREDVLKAWTLLEARKLARAAAEKKAKEVPAEKTLAEFFGAEKVTESGLFPWLRSFAAFGFGEPQLSQVEGVEYAGNEFMRSVFSLPIGGVGVAPNQPEAIFYVVRVAKRSPGDEVMRELFASSTPQRLFQQIGMVAFREHQELDNQWLEDLTKEYNLKWERNPRSVEF